VLPFKAPVIPAVRLLGMVPAVAEKFAEVAPAATVTELGRDNSPVEQERATLAPPADAVWLRVTVQFVEPPVPSVAGEQESPLSIGNGTVTAPSVPVMLIGPPAGVAAIRLDTPITLETAAGVIVTVITAATPFCIVLSLMPASRHVAAPGLEKQEIVLPAAMALAPATAVTDAMLLVA